MKALAELPRVFDSSGFSQRQYPSATALNKWEEDHGDGFHKRLYTDKISELIPQLPRTSSLRDEAPDDPWWTATHLKYNKEPQIDISLETDMDAWPLMSEIQTRKPSTFIHPFKVLVDQPSDEQRDEMFGGMSLREYKGDLVEKIEKAMLKRKLRRDPDVPIRVSIPESFHEQIEIRVNVIARTKKKRDDIVWDLRKAILKAFKELGEDWQLEWADPAAL